MSAVERTSSLKLIEKEKKPNQDKSSGDIKEDFKKLLEEIDEREDVLNQRLDTSGTKNMK